MELLLPALGYFVWTLVAFLIVFFILKKFAWKPILTTLNEREKNIADSIANAERVKVEMAQMKNENEAMIQKAREERAEMLKEAKEMKDRIVSEAKEQAKVEANKILIDAQASIEQQKNAALTDVKNSIGNMVIEVTEKVIRRELAGKAEQESYIRTLADDLTKGSRN
ncbi:F0F1 ATP synthase subunit B [Flavihumibacter profundi]|jgi:F-type H+-transporting ATPase subunit b|uniref:F0F1 ATP synthase subunit B n=1 Tax=Flavihumibacter profundi TaxID=2716883 RepID=UPI001CC40F7A|nr:F0F1 ATP synthase subunit B [Flavihumibacter profundi]MBZ5858102.1 F0F1 ATP synthase subunit B [Flavihumibacter profundi]